MAKLSFKKSMKMLFNLPKTLPIGWKLLRDIRIPRKNKIIFLLLSGGYLLFPYDLIFDIPFLGQFDDFAVFVFMFNWFINRVPKDILREYGWEQA